MTQSPLMETNPTLSAHITIADLYTVVKLIQDLADTTLWQGTKRLSDTEIAHITPAFTNIATFLRTYEEQVSKAEEVSPVVETVTEDLDLDTAE